MTTTVVPIKIKRRTSGSPGAPSSLLAGELAYNEVDGYFYVGFGDNGSGTATSIKTFASDSITTQVLPTGGTTGQVLTKNSSTNYDVSWSTISTGSTYTAGSGLSLSGGQFSVNTSVIAPLASPTFTGTPAAPTATAGTNTTQIATTAFVTAAFSNYSTTSSIAATYAPLASPAFTGTPTVPTASTSTNNTQAASTAFVVNMLASYLTAAATALTYAPLASPALTGTPTAPTATAGANTTQIATTAFVTGALASYPTTTTITSTYAPLASPALTGTPTAPTATPGTSTTQIATTAFVSAALSSYSTTTTISATYAPLASPSLTGTPTAPTATAGTNTTQVATTAFVQTAVQSAVQGLSPKQSVRAISTGNIATLSGLLTVDGVTLQSGDRVLLPFQSTASQNGIYVASSGAWSRSTDAATYAELTGAYTLAELGTVYGGHGFVCTNDPDAGGTIGTTSITFVEFTGATDITAGTGISKSGNTVSVNYGSGLTNSSGALVPDFTVVAALASPALSGVPTAPTASGTSSTTQIANMAAVQAAITASLTIIDGGTF